MFEDLGSIEGSTKVQGGFVIEKAFAENKMIKLIYFDFNFWRFDILRLALGYAKVPYECERVKRQDWPKVKQDFPFGQLPIMVIDEKSMHILIQ